MSLLPEVVCDKPPILAGKFQQRTKRQICLRDLSNQRELKMPDAPVIKLSMLSQSTSTSPLELDIPPFSVSANQHSTSGNTSPGHRSSAEGTLSVDLSSQDDATSGSNLSPQTQQQVPLAGSARQLSKLKRFLMTLQQFASDISPEIGERVRTLVLALINSHITIEDFHTKLQEATNFPLRPFVVPFLKANLPFLQRELLESSPRHSIFAFPTPFFSSSIQSYLLQSSPKETISPAINANGKRPSPDRTKENGYDYPPAKRLRPISPVAMTTRPNSHISSRRHHISAGHTFTDDMRLAQDLLERDHGDAKEVDRVERDRVKHLDGYGSEVSQNHHTHLIHNDQEDWQFVESMLNNIIVMVDRCKRILESLEERNRRYREETAASLLRTHPKLIDADYRRCSVNGVSPAYGAHGGSDDQLSLVHRRTEEAIHEVRMQAVVELQQAVTAAEVKASHIVAAERAKMELAILEARKQAHEEILAALGHQEKSSENCWNCGRKANETCSGCRMARYCGSYCQHKDWENHHRICGSKVQLAQSNSCSRDEHKGDATEAAAVSQNQSFSTGNVSSTDRVDPAVVEKDLMVLEFRIQGTEDVSWREKSISVREQSRIQHFKQRFALQINFKC